MEFFIPMAHSEQNRQKAEVFPGNDTQCAFLMRICRHVFCVSEQNEEKVHSVKHEPNENSPVSL